METRQKNTYYVVRNGDERETLRRLERMIEKIIGDKRR